MVSLGIKSVCLLICSGEPNINAHQLMTSQRNNDKKRGDGWVWGLKWKTYTKIFEKNFDSLTEYQSYITILVMESQKNPHTFSSQHFCSPSLSPHAHFLSLNLPNTLHYLSCDALHAAHSSVQVFEVTRSSDHLTYFIKNTWDTAQTDSLPSSLGSTRLPQSSDTSHPSSSQMGRSYHVSFIFA